MIDIRVLLENTTNSKSLKSKHGLSIAINSKKNILLDAGPDETFSNNSKIMGIDINTFDFMVLSHSHIDHGGGIDAFCKENNHARIYMLENEDHKYYVKMAGIINMPVGLKYSQDFRTRISKLKTNAKIDEGIWFIKYPIRTFKTPKFNNSLYVKKNGKYVQDDFSHEGILVIEDNGELVLFNSCSHGGVLNSIESVSMEFPGKKIRSYVGGFHFFNPMNKKHETDEDMKQLVDYVKEKGIHLYTGHCTGEYCYNYLKKNLNELIDKLQTGLETAV